MIGVVVVVEIRCRVSAVKQAKRPEKEGGEGCDYEVKSGCEASAQRKKNKKVVRCMS